MDESQGLSRAGMGESVGRDYEGIHRTVAGFCSIGESDEQARAKVPQAVLDRFRSGNRIYSDLIGSPATIREHLAELEAAGVQEVILGCPATGYAALLRARVHCFVTMVQFAPQGLQGGNGPLGVVGDPHRLTTPSALGTQRSEHVFRRRSGATVFSCHNALTFLQEAGYHCSPVHRAVRRPYTRAASGMKITSRPTHQASACPMTAASGWLSSSPRTALITTEIG
jgi:hypothetical protein